jgi:hypothetical protein
LLKVWGGGGGGGVEGLRGLYRSLTNFKGTSDEMLRQQHSRVRQSKRDETTSHHLQRPFISQRVVHVTETRNGQSSAGGVKGRG